MLGALPQETHVWLVGGLGGGNEYLAVQLPGTEATSASGHSPLDGPLQTPLKKVQWRELSAELRAGPILFEAEVLLAASLSSWGYLCETFYHFWKLWKQECKLKFFSSLSAHLCWNLYIFITGFHEKFRKSVGLLSN